MIQGCLNRMHLELDIPKHFFFGIRVTSISGLGRFEMEIACSHYCILNGILIKKLLGQVDDPATYFRPEKF